MAWILLLRRREPLKNGFYDYAQLPGKMGTKSGEPANKPIYTAKIRTKPFYCHRFVMPVKYRVI